MCPNNPEFSVTFNSSKFGIMKGYLAEFDVVRSHPMTLCNKYDQFSSVTLQTGDGRYLLSKLKGQHEINIIRIKNTLSFGASSSELLDFAHDEHGKQFLDKILLLASQRFTIRFIIKLLNQST